MLTHFRSPVQPAPFVHLRHGARLMTLAAACAALIFTGLAAAADAPSGGGISLGSTRVVYNEAQGGAAVRVMNSSTSPFLIQTWVSAYQGEGFEKTPPLAENTFIATPPLYRQDKGETAVRIVRVSGGFPADRESIFWLNVKSIPATEKPKPGTNFVQFAFNNRLKLLYRPAGLQGIASEAYKSLTFSREGSAVVAQNPTPYFLTVNKLMVGGVRVTDSDQRVVPPMSTQRWPLPQGAGTTVSFTTINDYGGPTDPLTVPLK